MAKSPPSTSPAALLAAIGPVGRQSRFLQTWDPAARQLWLGCADHQRGVWIGSRRQLATTRATLPGPSRLTRHTVDRWRSSGRQRVEGSALFSRLRDLLVQYVCVADDRVYLLLTLWVIGTYLYAMFSHYGYLFLHSKVKRSAKTRTLEILHHVVFEASVPLNSPTTAAMRDTATAGGGVLLDSIERWKEKSPEAFSAAMELLEAGFRNGGTVMKMVKGADGNWRRELFPVYAPYALAAIGRDSLADTALDRSFVIEMRRKPIRVKKARYSHDSCEQACAPLRDDLYLWALENAEAVWNVYQSPGLDAEVDSLQLHDRAADIWRPILAIQQFILGSGEAGRGLAALAVEMGGDTEAADALRCLEVVRAFRRALAGQPALVGMTNDLVALLPGLGLDQLALHEMLTTWGFVQKEIRLAGGPRRAWALTAAALAKLEQGFSP